MDDGSVRYNFTDGKKFDDMASFEEFYEKHFNRKLKLEEMVEE